MTELLPCPFCGAPDPSDKHDNAILCTNPNCGASVDIGHSIGEGARRHARIVWNKRYPIPASAQGAMHLADAPDDDDNTMRDDPMFNRGVQHVVDMLARTLAPLGGWYAGDGSEDYDCDLEETLRNILAAKGLYDKETGEFATPPAQTEGDRKEPFTAANAWDELVHKDDRTSPEDYPEMCLITADELRDFMERAAPSSHPSTQRLSGDGQ